MIAVMRVAVLSLAFALAVPVCLPSQDSSREQAVASLDALVRQLDELRARVADAREAVDQERDDVAAARSLQTVHEQVTRLAREFSDGTLKVRMVLDPIRTKLSDAVAIYEHDDSIKALKQVETEAEGSGRHDAPALVALARYHAAEKMRMEAELRITTSRNDQRAARELVLALNQYEQVRKGTEDLSDPDICESIYAASLWRQVQINAALCEGYLDMLKKEPANRTYRKKFEGYKQDASELAAELKHRFRDTRMADGRTMDQVVRADMERLFSRF